MNGGRHEETWAGFFAVNDMNGQIKAGAIGQNRNFKLNRFSAAGSERQSANLKHTHPRPRVFVRPGLAARSKNSRIALATSLPEAFSMPSRPGDEFTSITTGP